MSELASVLCRRFSAEELRRLAQRLPEPLCWQLPEPPASKWDVACALVRLMESTPGARLLLWEAEQERPRCVAELRAAWGVL